MGRTLDVYGFTDINPNPNGSVKGAQVRVIVAAHSVAEVLRVAGISRTTYAWTGSTTMNDDEVAQALSEPLTPFYRELNNRDGRWYLYPVRPAQSRRSLDPLANGASMEGATKSAADVLRDVRAGQGKPFYEARPLHAVPDQEVNGRFTHPLPKTTADVQGVEDAAYAEIRAVYEKAVARAALEGNRHREGLLAVYRAGLANEAGVI